MSGARGNLVLLNGQLFPAGEARLPVLDFGYLYGYGLFETLRAYAGVPFRLDRHLSRLEQACKALELPPPGGEHDLPPAIQRTLSANGLTDARIRITVSLQGEKPVPEVPAEKQVNVLITVSPLPLRPEGAYEKGYEAMVSSITRNSASPLSRLKSIGYLENLLARQEAHREGAQEALMLNEKGMLACASAANIFLVLQGQLLTPSVESGIRAGVTRETVLELAQKLAIDGTERAIAPKELLLAEEAFLTSSILEIMPLTRMDRKQIGTGRPGPVTSQLMESYRKMAREIR